MLADAGGLRAPRERAAQIRAELLDGLSSRRARVGSEPLWLRDARARRAGGVREALLAIAPVDPALRADPNAANDRAWTLVAALVGALVEGAAAMAAGAAQDLALHAGEWEGWLTLAFPVPADDVLTAVELAVESFEEAIDDVDRLKARAYAIPTVALGDVGELRHPIGELHPLRIAEAVARFGGRPADPARSSSTRRRSSRCSTRRPRSRVRTRRRIPRCASRAACSSA